jgi:hypothetical protein
MLLQKSRLTCGYDRVRPKPPKSTLPSTKVGQVVEFKDGDWWRTAVCARDVELLPDNDQQITKVVLPGADPAVYPAAAGTQ